MKLSVIIPVYNAEQYIIQTLNCLIYQTLKDLEIIILQDACTDNTDRLVTEYIATHPDRVIKTVKFEKNQGPSHARNVGVQIASGDYIHFMDADDLINVDFYQKLFDAAIETNADVACSGFLNERYPAQSITYDCKLVLTNPQDIIDQTHIDRRGYSCRYLIKRDFWQAEQFCFPEHMYYCEDIAIIPRVILSANHLVVVPDTFYIYKYRKNSLLTSKDRQPSDIMKANDRERHLIRDRLYQDYNIRPSQPHIESFEYKLFGHIPFIYTKYYSERCIKKIYVFGIMILKRRYK